MFDGMCNNLQYFMWGVFLIFFKCLLSFVYENGYNIFVGWQDVEGRLSVCFVLIELILFNEVIDDVQYIYMLMQWGQFLDYDIDFIVSSLSMLRFSDGLDCMKQYNVCDNQLLCFFILILDNDFCIKGYGCMQFICLSVVCGIGMILVFFSVVILCEQMN